MGPQPEIRDMTEADVVAVGAATEAAGWRNREDFFRRGLAMPNCRPIVGVLDGKPVGTGLATIHGSVGWVGVIFVVPELRGRGLGRAMTERTCEILEAAGCRSLVLVATDLGRPVYEKLGFRVQTEYHLLSHAPLAEAPLPPRGTSIRPVRPDDLGAIAALDREASGEDRRPLIEAHVADAWLLEDEARVRAFLFPTTRGNGAVVAERVEDGVSLLDLHRHLTEPGQAARAGLVTENEAGRRALGERGWTLSRSLPRMVRGPDPAWRPERIWGQFNHAMG